MQPFAECLSLLAFEFNESMGDVIFVQEIIELVSVTIVPRCQDPKSRKLTIATQSAATHD